MTHSRVKMIKHKFEADVKFTENRIGSFSAQGARVFENEVYLKTFSRNCLSSYQSFIRQGSHLIHIRKVFEIRGESLFLLNIKSIKNVSEMFWFLRRTGAANFLSSFNNNISPTTTSKVIYKNEKNNSGCQKYSYVKKVCLLMPKRNVHPIVKLCQAWAPEGDFPRVNNLIDCCVS